MSTVKKLATKKKVENGKELKSIPVNPSKSDRLKARIQAVQQMILRENAVTTGMIEEIVISTLETAGIPAEDYQKYKFADENYSRLVLKEE